jgi:hypothetical protein
MLACFIVFTATGFLMYFHERFRGDCLLSTLKSELGRAADFEKRIIEECMKYAKTQESMQQEPVKTSDPLDSYKALSQFLAQTRIHLRCKFGKDEQDKFKKHREKYAVDCPCGSTEFLISGVYYIQGNNGEGTTIPVVLCMCQKCFIITHVAWLPIVNGSDVKENPPA